MAFERMLRDVHDMFPYPTFATLPEVCQRELAVAWYSDHPEDLGEVMYPDFKALRALIVGLTDEAEAGRLLMGLMVDSVRDCLSNRWIEHVTEQVMEEVGYA